MRDTPNLMVMSSCSRTAGPPARGCALLDDDLAAVRERDRDRAMKSLISDVNEVEERDFT